MTQPDELTKRPTDGPKPAPRRPIRLVAAPAAGLAALALLLLAACSGGGDSSNSSSAASSGGGDRVPGQAVGTATSGGKEAAPAPAQPSPGPAGDQSGGSAQPEARIAPNRALIRRADLTVRVKDVNAKANDLTRIAADNDGSVYSDNRSGTGRTATAEIVLKLDPDRLDAALTRISALGKEIERTSSTEDVTEQVADVDSRVASMKASIARVRAILARASSIGDVVNVEGELSRREAELESLQARQRTLAGQIALSTVTVHLVAEEAPAPAPAAANETDPGFLTGLKNGWSAFAGTVAWLLTVVGAVLPFLLIVLPLLAGWFYLQRQRRTGTPALPAATPEPPAA